MGARGKAALPTVMREARGGPKRSTDNHLEPRDNVAAPEMPAGLPKAAREHWDFIVPRLIQRRTVSELDLGLLASMCIEWAEYMGAVAALEKLKKSGKSYKGHLIDHPRVVIKGAFDRYKQASDRFGLSPSSKTRVQMTPAEKAEKKKPQGQYPRIADDAPAAVPA